MIDQLIRELEKTYQVQWNLREIAKKQSDLKGTLSEVSSKPSTTRIDNQGLSAIETI